jgi:hypothetical protein
MVRLWARARAPLLRWREPDCSEQVNNPDRLAIEAFRAIYGEHIASEEGLVYPAARTRMDAAALTAMGRQMRARRQT